MTTPPVPEETGPSPPPSRPPRRPPMASISSMKPMAPPSSRAALRRALKKARILAGGHAVPHGLETGRRHEQERHPGVTGHGLGHVGLAGPGLALEQDPAAGCRPGGP